MSSQNYSVVIDYLMRVFPSVITIVVINLVYLQGSLEMGVLSRLAIFEMIKASFGNFRSKEQEGHHIQGLQMAERCFDHLFENIYVRKPCIIQVIKLTLTEIGIPTSRATSLIVSDTKVQRDPLYEGNVIWEKCAVVLRLAPTFFRFGSFEIFKEKDKYSGRVAPSVGLKDQMMP